MTVQDPGLWVDRSVHLLCEAMVTAWKIRAKGGFHFSPLGALVIGYPTPPYLPPILFLETFYSYAFIIFVRVGVSVDQN